MLTRKFDNPPSQIEVYFLAKLMRELSKMSASLFPLAKTEVFKGTGTEACYKLDMQGGYIVAGVWYIEIPSLLKAPPYSNQLVGIGEGGF